MQLFAALFTVIGVLGTLFHLAHLFLVIDRMSIRLEVAMSVGIIVVGGIAGYVTNAMIYAILGI